MTPRTVTRWATDDAARTSTATATYADGRVLLLKITAWAVYVTDTATGERWWRQTWSTGWDWLVVGQREMVGLLGEVERTSALGG